MSDRSSETAAKLPSANDIKLIIDANKAVVASGKNGLEHAIECGEMLKAAKEKVGHGNWEPWLLNNCPDIKPRTASYYMRLAGKADELEKIAEQNGNTVADLSTRAAKRLLAEPKTPSQIAAAKAEKEKKAAEKERKAVLAQEQSRAEWIKTLGATGLCEYLTVILDKTVLRQLVEQINKKLVPLSSSSLTTAGLMARKAQPLPSVSPID